MGIAGLKKVSGEMLGLFPSSVLTRVSGHPHTSFPEFQWEVKVEITCGTSLYVKRHLAVPSSCLLVLA